MKVLDDKIMYAVGGGYVLMDARTYQPSGKVVTEVTVRVKARTRYEDTTDYYLKIWGQRAIPLARALTKGRFVVFLGEEKTSIHPKRGEIMEVINPELWIGSMSAKSLLGQSQQETLEFDMEELLNG